MQLSRGMFWFLCSEQVIQFQPTGSQKPKPTQQSAIAGHMNANLCRKTTSHEIANGTLKSQNVSTLLTSWFFGALSGALFDSTDSYRIRWVRGSQGIFRGFVSVQGADSKRKISSVAVRSIKELEVSVQLKIMSDPDWKQT